MRKKRQTRGQALVEFCLTFPLVLIFLFAIVDVACIGFQRITLQAAAADGARLAATLPRPSKAAVVARVKASAPGLQLFDDSVGVTFRRGSSRLPGIRGEALVEVRTVFRPLSAALMPKVCDKFSIIVRSVVPIFGRGSATAKLRNETSPSETPESLPTVDGGAR